MGLSNTSLYRQDINSTVFTSRAQQYQNYFTNTTSTTAIANSSPTDLSMKQPSPSLLTTQIPSQSQSSLQQSAPNIQQQSQQQQQQQQTQQQLQSQQQPPPSSLQTSQQSTNLQMQPQQAPPQRPPILSHKLNASEISAVRQLVTGYRESAAFLLRSADELETLLLNQNLS